MSKSPFNKNFTENIKYTFKAIVIKLHTKVYNVGSKSFLIMTIDIKVMERIDN